MRILNINYPVFLRIALVNLFIVAFLGCILRYKIAFSLPIIDQKYLLESHSHFAFTGWVTHTLMVLLVMLLNNYAPDRSKRFRFIIYFNLILAYLMLISFALSGYSVFSIILATLSLVAFFIFGSLYWRSLTGSGVLPLVQSWVKMAIICGAISSLGTFFLAYMMAEHHITEKKYLGSLYFFLHFQYNGWFLFSCFALFFDLLKRIGVNLPNAGKVLRYFSLSVIPAYLLSILWWNLSIWLYSLTVLAAILQSVGLIYLIIDLFRQKNKIKNILPNLIRWTFSLSLIALVIKTILQLGSLIPALRKLAFGYRSIVIGYLHLALLGIITIFLIGYLVYKSGYMNNKKTKNAIWIFLTGIILNEIALMLQGLTGMSYINIPFINQALFFIALLILVGTIALNFSLRFRTDPFIEAHYKAEKE